MEDAKKILVTYLCTDQYGNYDIALQYVVKNENEALALFEEESRGRYNVVDIMIVDYNKEFNQKELELIEAIREAEQYVVGKLELDYEEDGWYARDYRKDFEAAVDINNSKYNKPIISFNDEKQYNVNVRECCNYCNIYYVG